ncbi:MAG: sulfate adenylyltransferase [Thermoplasmatales archaeon]
MTAKDIGFLGHGGKKIHERIYKGNLESLHTLISIDVSSQTANECLGIGYGFLSPLEGFMNRNETDSVCSKMSLSDDTLWSIPINLNVAEEEIKTKGIREGDDVLLTYDKKPLAVLNVEEIFNYNLEDMARQVYGTTDQKHPGVKRTLSQKGRFIAGKVELVQEPVFQPPFDKFWLTPRQHFELYKKKGWKHIVAHQTRNVPHTGHEWLMKYCWFAANEDLPVDELKTGVLVNAVIGEKRIGDYIDEAIVLGQAELGNAGYFKKDVFAVSILLWDMRYAGPKEAIHHAIVRTNIGCTHHMFGRDHAGVGNFYKPYDAHYLLKQVKDRLRIKPIFMMENYYCTVCGEVTNAALDGHEDKSQSFSGTLIRSILIDGVKPTRGLMRPEVFDKVMEASEKYGSGSPFVSEEYLKKRNPIFTLSRDFRGE